MKKVKKHEILFTSFGRLIHCVRFFSNTVENLNYIHKEIENKFIEWIIFYSYSQRIMKKESLGK